MALGYAVLNKKIVGSAGRYLLNSGSINVVDMSIITCLILMSLSTNLSNPLNVIALCDAEFEIM